MGSGISDFLTFTTTDLHSTGKLLVACFLGAALGLEREITKHPAGLRTHILVSLGCASFIIAGFYMAKLFPGSSVGPGQALQGAITGMGFIGAGAIMKEGVNVHGITTAASLWVSGSIGVLCACGAFALAIATTLIGLIALILSRPEIGIEHRQEKDQPAAQGPETK